MPPVEIDGIEACLAAVGGRCCFGAARVHGFAAVGTAAVKRIAQRGGDLSPVMEAAA